VKVTDDTSLKVYWGQLHGIRIIRRCDTIEHYYAYGRDIGMLDVCAANDHAEAMSTRRTAAAEPRRRPRLLQAGQFVTLAVTNGRAGHRNVYS